MASMEPSARLRAAKLCLLATASVSRRPLLDAVAAAIAGGVDMVQLREKSAGDPDVLAAARSLRALCERHGALFVVNDRIEVARDAGADGVHLGQDDAAVVAARASLPEGTIVGVSTHDLGELRRALADGADYVGVGAVFATRTKGRDVPVSGPATLAPLAAAAEAAGVPAFAIGGITPRNASEVAAAGFSRIAVCAGVLAADDPGAAAAAILSALRR